MKEIQLQTPQRDQASANRRSKSATDLNKNMHKASKKRLSPAFKAASEYDYAVLESLKELPEAESAENVIAEVDPASTYSSETVGISALTSPTLSSVSVITNTNCESPEADFFDEIKSIEKDMMIKHLREARLQVLKSKDVGSSKKILDALIHVVIEEFDGGVHEENGWLGKLQSRKAQVVFLSLMFGIYAVLLMVCLFKSDANGFHNTGPTPT